MASSQVNLWYNGDFDGSGSLLSERETEVRDARTYDNFRTGRGWVVNQVFGNFLTENLRTSRLYFEIRRGVSRGNGGALVAAGTVDIAQNLATGRSSMGMDERHIRGRVGNITLADNTEYWLAIAPIGDGRGRAYVTITDGNDRGPAGDPNPEPVGLIRGFSFVDSPPINFNYEPVDNIFGRPVDFSYGVAGVPEPATALALGAAIAALLRRRK
jgi:hypothetical protein